MLHHQQNIRFKCTACGKCCYGDSNAYIKLNSRDTVNIAHRLDISPAHLKRNYLVQLIDGGYGISIKETGACALLGKDGKCRVYTVRPMQCRTYPYWPEILTDNTAWRKEKKRCEGIDQGEIVDNVYIEKQLKLSIIAEDESY